MVLTIFERNMSWVLVMRMMIRSIDIGKMKCTQTKVIKRATKRILRIKWVKANKTHKCYGPRKNQGEQKPKMGWQKLYAPSTCITFVAVFTGLLFHKIMIIRKKKHFFYIRRYTHKVWYKVKIFGNICKYWIVCEFVCQSLKSIKVQNHDF